MQAALGFASFSAKVILLRRSSSLVRRCSAKMSTATAPAPDSASTFKIALCQIPVTASKEDNLRVASDALREAASNGAQVAVLPECFNSPYDTSCFKEYAESLPNVGHQFETPSSSPSFQMLRETARDKKMVIVGGSMPERGVDDLIYNTSLTVNAGGDVVAKHRKVHLFDVNVPNGICFRESDALAAGNSSTAFRVSVPTTEGNTERIDVGIGVGICYDLRFPEMAMIAAREAGAEVLIFPGAFNMTTGPAHWELLLRARAVDNQLYVAACSPARKTSGRGYTAWGHSSVIDPWGSVIATTDEKSSIVYADVNLKKVAQVRAAIPTSMQRRNDIYMVSAMEKK